MQVSEVEEEGGLRVQTLSVIVFLKEASVEEVIHRLMLRSCIRH